MPLITNVMGSTASEVAQLVEAHRRPRRGRGDRAQRLVPERQDRTGHRRRPRLARGAPARRPPADVQAAHRQAHAEHRGRRGRRARRRGGGGGRRLAHQHATRERVASGGGGRSWLGGGTGGLSGPAIRCIALAQIASVARRVAVPIVGMGGVTHGTHARDLLSAGATLVAVGTESFRDPAAGSRIARELKSLQIAGSRSTYPA